MYTPPSTFPRRGLNARQQATVEKLFDAAEALLEESEYEELTIRMVAAEAAVSPATAYTYFSSKDHLFATLFWRYIARHEIPEFSGTTVERLQEAVRFLSGVVAASPALAAAATRSLLGTEPDVERVRLNLGGYWLECLNQAIGDEDSRLARTLVYLFSGALLEAGMGIIDYESLGDDLARVIARVAEGIE